jgi:hypothetical protein
MKKTFVTLAGAAVLAVFAATIQQTSRAQNRSTPATEKTPAAAALPDAAKTGGKESTPAYVTEIPPGYRDWRLISVAREEGKIDDIRAVLGNDLAIKAYREGTLPFPDGAIIARLAWSLVSSEENNQAFGRDQSFVAGAPKNGVQFMIKDSTKYAATGGWGYGQFNDGKSIEASTIASCYDCHLAIKNRDFVFTKYAH